MFVYHGRFSQVTDNITSWASPQYLCMQILPHSQGKYARNICVCCMDNNEHWTYMSSNAEKALILFWRKSEKARFWKWVAWRCTHAVGGGGWSASQYTADICRDTEWTKTHACSVVGGDCSFCLTPHCLTLAREKGEDFSSHSQLQTGCAPLMPSPRFTVSTKFIQWTKAKAISFYDIISAAIIIRNKSI